MKTLVKIRFGSHLYGTSTPESDTDYKSVHIPSASDIILQRAKSTVSRSTKSDTSIKNGADDVDDESFAVHKFMKMLRVGDMVATELLFAPPVESSDLWQSYFIEPRRRYLNKRIEGFVGYCQKQAAKYGIKGSRVSAVRNALECLERWISSHGEKVKLGVFSDEIMMHVTKNAHTDVVDVLQSSGENIRCWEVCGRKMPFTISIKTAYDIMKTVFDNYGHRSLLAESNEGVDWKAISHAVRVGEQAIELVTTGHITFPRPNADELLMIKKGGLPYKIAADRLESLLDEVKEASAKSNLPENPDELWMDSMTYLLYSAHVRRTG